MEIYRIEDYKKTKKLVYLCEDAPAFCLYNKEIKKYDLKEGEDLSDEIYEEIMEALKKRARERALYLLEDMARTENQIRKKLREGYYPDEAVDSAIEYCKDKHYIDDFDFAVRFIESRSGTLSKKMIMQKLYLKGISKELAEEAFEEADVDESKAVYDLIVKKYGSLESYQELPFEEKNSFIRKLMTRGFGYDAIKAAGENQLDII